MYPLGAPTLINPWVLTIENLPNKHVQAGAWIGWSTRYNNPKKFKIDVFNVYDYNNTPGLPPLNQWVTVADISNYFEGNHIVRLGSLSVSKIRLTIYEGTGPNGQFGLSEFFFLHPEATIAYDKLRVRYNADENVGIGTTTPTEKLSVNWEIRAKEIKVEATNWPDYVFNENYNLTSLENIESYIIDNKYLPDIPSVKEVKENGISLGKMNALLLKKIEELTLHLIEKDKQVEFLKKEMGLIHLKLNTIENNLKK